MVHAQFPGTDVIGELHSPFGPFGPRLNIGETRNAYEITVEVPGMGEDDLDIYVSDDVLTISGHKTRTEERSDLHYHRSERAYGSFCRRFRLSDAVEQDKIEATIEQGVLRLSLPKRTPTRKLRNIEIESN
jgi:HSP20 family protein